jgi:hypothetical protein
MGIFSFFSSDNNKGTLNSVADEFRNLNLENLLEKSDFYEEHKYEGKFNSITYEAKLDSPFLNIFDGIRIRVSSPNKELEKFAIVTFVLLSRKVSIKEASLLVNKINNLLKEDDNWTDVDKMRIESGVWRGRSYMNSIMVAIEMDSIDGITLCITGYKDFLNHIAND